MQAQAQAQVGHWEGSAGDHVDAYGGRLSKQMTARISHRPVTSGRTAIFETEDPCHVCHAWGDAMPMPRPCPRVPARTLSPSPQYWSHYPSPILVLEYSTNLLHSLLEQSLLLHVHVLSCFSTYR